MVKNPHKKFITLHIIGLPFRENKEIKATKLHNDMKIYVIPFLEAVLIQFDLSIAAEVV
jgi:hypothetical protein